jgi:rhombotail lipoprotein
MSILSKALKAHLFAGVTCCALLSGCAPYVARDSSSIPLGSVIDPVKDSRQISTKTSLTFPASIAIMFVPGKERDLPKTILREAADSLKAQLMSNPKYVRSVSIVTMDDTSAKVSLDDVRALYDAEIAVILSYDQDQISRQNGPGALIDFTVVGAFVAPTAKTETHTHVDGQVVHIVSNALIFRQSGTDKRSEFSTPYGRESAMNSESMNSFLAATTDFGNALANTLTKFDNFDLSQAVSMSVAPAGSNDKESTDGHANSWNKVDSFKFNGGGSLDLVTFVLMLLGLCFSASRRAS